MAWTTPRTWVSGELVTSAQFNAHLRDNLSALYGGAMAITSQAAGDVIIGASASALGRLAIGAQYTVLQSTGSAPSWVSSITGTVTWNAGAVTSSGPLTVTDGTGYGIYTSQTELNSHKGYNADGVLYINWTGYNAGTTRFRTTLIANGKNGTIATFDGPTSATTLTGLLTVSGGGTHTFSGAVSGASNALTIKNTTNDANAFASFEVLDNAGATVGQVRGNNVGSGTSGWNAPDAFVLHSARPAGMSIIASDGSGAIRFYCGGTLQRMKLWASGGLSYGNDTDPGSGAMTIGAPTGGGKGGGTLNAEAVYDDGTILTDWVFDLAYAGVSQHAIPAGGRLYTLAETVDVTAKERRLPWMPTRDAFEQERSLGKMMTNLWFGQEQQQLYIQQHDAHLTTVDARIAALEREIAGLKAQRIH